MWFYVKNYKKGFCNIVFYILILEFNVYYVLFWWLINWVKGLVSCFYFFGWLVL